MSVAAVPAGRRPWLFGEPDFRRLWFVGLVVFAVRWLEMLAVAVFVYQRTGSPFLVAAMTMLRALPMGLFGAPIGAAAERFERRSVLIGVVMTMLLSSLVLAVLAWAGLLQNWHIAVASFVNGIGWATDNPVRRTMIGEAVGPDRMGAAMAVDVGANNASRMLGPILGGALLETVGIVGAFALSVIGYFIATIAASRLRQRYGPRPSAPASMLARMIDGFILVGRDRRLVGVLVITVIYNLFGWPFTAMVPVIGQDNLHLGAAGVGVLASMDGVGAFAGAVAIGLYARQVHFARLYIGGATAYLVILIGFALTDQPVVAGTALMLTGLAGAGFSTMQATLVYLAAPAEMRGRVFGVLSVCIGVGPIGFFHIGWLASLVGAPWATVITGVEGLLALALTWRWWRVL